MMPHRYMKQSGYVLADGSKAEFYNIPNYGRYESSVKVFPVTMEPAAQFEKSGSVEGLPYTEYAFCTEKAGDYTIRVYLAPSNNLDGDKVELRYAVQVDEQESTVVNALSKGFAAGDWSTGNWCQGVIINAHICESKTSLTAGKHTLRFYGIDAGLVLEKLVLYQGTLPESYLGPEESCMV